MQIYENNVRGLKTVWELRKFLGNLGITKEQSKIIHREKDDFFTYFSMTLDVSESTYDLLISELQKITAKNIEAVKLPDYCKHFVLSFEFTHLIRVS
jgi:VanZ family protein